MDISLGDITSEEEDTDSGVSVYEPNEEELKVMGYQYGVIISNKYKCISLKC